MIPERILARARARYRVRMRATCEVTRLTGTETTDDHGNVTQSRVTVYPDPGWSTDHPDTHGPCYVNYPGLPFETTFGSAGVAISQSRVTVLLPLGVPFEVGDRVEMLFDPDTPQIEGTIYRVASVGGRSQAPVQRLLVEDNQSGVSGG